MTAQTDRCRQVAIRLFLTPPTTDTQSQIVLWVYRRGEAQPAAFEDVGLPVDAPEGFQAVLDRFAEYMPAALTEEWTVVFRNNVGRPALPAGVVQPIKASVNHAPVILAM